MPTEFEKWWENKGYFLAKEQNLLGNSAKNLLADPVEIARLGFQAGLFTSPVLRGSEFEFKSHFVKCTCTCQMLEAQLYDYKDGDCGVNFAMWGRGRSGKNMTWRERIRWCWQILKTGSPWADDIIATNEDARGLAMFLLANLPKEESNEETKV